MMASDSKQRTRAAAYTPDEKFILLDCISRHKDVLENKKSDGCSIDKKNKAWNQVVDAYNSHMNVTQRTVEQLRKAWENIKARTKKDLNASGRLESRLLALPPMRHHSDANLDVNISYLDPFSTPLGKRSPSTSELSYHNDVAAIIDYDSDVDNRPNHRTNSTNQQLSNCHPIKCEVILEEPRLRQPQPAPSDADRLSPLRLREATAAAVAAEMRAQAEKHKVEAEWHKAEAEKHKAEAERYRATDAAEELDFGRKRRKILLERLSGERCSPVDL